MSSEPFFLVQASDHTYVTRSPPSENNEWKNNQKNLLKLMSKGIPKASAQWTCANVGGFQIIASAAKVHLVRGHRE